MTAEYTTSLLYPGNPYVEALPPKTFFASLTYSFEFSAGDRAYPYGVYTP